MIKLLFDMGLPRRACSDLRSLGWDAVHLGELGQARLGDADIVQLANQEKRSIVTLDHDFARLVALSGKSSPSIILVRQRVARQAAVALLVPVLQRHAVDLAAGCLMSVTQEMIRIRRLPVQPQGG